LAAYVVPRKEYAFEEAASQELDRVSHWRDLHEEVYRQGTLGSDPELNRVGWNSSYTGQPLSEEEMRDWAVATADRILARKPRRVLEIGCGTGMLLFRIAPHCERYVAWDFSETALAHVRQVLDAGRSLPGLKLENRRAHDFGGIDEGSFDAVILNSVVQYFPSADYLHRVLEKAVEAVAPPGFLWVGDVRSLPLLEAYAASVQLRQADENLTREELGERVRRQFTEEEELALHPRFFHALRERLPAIRGSQVLLKPGRYLNEMARFRYDVLLHVGGETMSPAEVSWKDWDHERLDLPSLRRTLSDSRTEALGVRRIPNARLTAERQVLTWMRESGSPATVGAFRSTVKEDGLEPDLVASLGAELGYRVEVDWSAHEEDGAFDAVFSRNGFQGNWRESIVEPISRPLANDPIRAALARRLPSLLRAHVRDRLPEAMVPETVILLDALPLTANGKVDRRALPEPESVLSTSPRGSVAPMTPLQARLAGLWTEVLGLSRPVGLQDSFFELGGHSLLGVQLLSRVSAAFDVELPIRALFEAPTVSAMAERLARRWKTVDPSVRSMVPIQPGGSRRPFFCAAPGPGSAFPYFRLASLLGAEQPFFGLEDPRMGTGPSDLEGVEALAAYHIQGLRKVQPQGPYFLGGWCFGGLVAFEMARQLALAGERVGLLALIDCSILPPGARSPLRELAFTLEQIRSSVPLLWDNLYVRASRVRGRAPVGNGSLPSAIASYVQRKAADALYRQLRKRVDFSHITEASLARLDLPAVRQFLTTVTATARDTLRYVGKPYDGRVTLLRARSGMTVNNAELDPTLGWAAYSQEGVSVRTVAGDHVSMFTYPHVRDLARELKDCLDQAQSR
jgi:thioesterase domain-containing protein/SAM-dependent methyltransferase